jgi:nifR3 family TIM-barrel protein
MFKIGDITINNKVVLAPMAGITSFGYRKFMSKYGPGYVVTEMISDMGLIYGNKETLSYIKFEKSGLPTCVQLFGSNPENMKKAVQIVESLNPNIDFFDINMGCPVNKVIKTGAGSALMKNPKLCGDIVRAMKEVTDKPITVKIRLGIDMSHLTFMEVIDEVTKAGASLVAIHPRTTKEMYGGQPHWELIKDLRSKMSIPLVVSGNINSVNDAVKALEITGADAVMVARGAVGKPYLIRNINNYFEGKELISTSLVEQAELCKELARDLIDEKGEAVAMRVFRGIATKFFDGFPNNKKLKQRLSGELSTYDDLISIINDYMKENLN